MDVADTGSEDGFRLALREVASDRARRDGDLGVSPPDRPSLRSARWQRLHSLGRQFDDKAREMIDDVVDVANGELAPYGFRVQRTPALRLLSGELRGVGYLIASASGLAPIGTLTCKLCESGNIQIGVEGASVPTRANGSNDTEIDVPLAELTRKHVELALLDFVRSALGGTQHSFAE